MRFEAALLALLLSLAPGRAALAVDAHVPGAKPGQAGSGSAGASAGAGVSTGQDSLALPTLVPSLTPSLAPKGPSLQAAPLVRPAESLSLPRAAVPAGLASPRSSPSLQAGDGDKGNIATKVSAETSQGPVAEPAVDEPASGKQPVSVRERLESLGERGGSLRELAGREGEMDAGRAAAAGREAFDRDRARIEAPAVPGRQRADPAPSGLAQESAVDVLDRAARLAASGDSSAKADQFKTDLAGVLQAMGRPSKFLRVAAAATQAGRDGIVSQAQQVMKSALLAKSKDVARAQGLPERSIVTHGTSLQGLLGMLVSGKIEATNPHVGFSGESLAVWGAYGLEGGASYGATRSIRRGQPAVSLILHNAAKPLKVEGGEVLNRAPVPAEDFLAAVVSDGERILVLTKKDLQALAASAERWKKWATDGAYRGRMGPFMEWERYRDRLAQY